MKQLDAAAAPSWFAYDAFAGFYVRFSGACPRP